MLSFVSEENLGISTRVAWKHHVLLLRGVQRDTILQIKKGETRKRRLRQRHGTGGHHTPPIVESTYLPERGETKRGKDAQRLADMTVRRSRATESKAQRVATSRRCQHRPEALVLLLLSDRYMHAGFTTRSAKMSLSAQMEQKPKKGKGGSRATVAKKGRQQRQRTKN